MSENGADVSWSDVGKVLEDERSSVEDIQTDLARNNKGNICQSIDNCMTVFQRDPLLKGAIRKNELSGKIDIVGNLGWERTSSSLTDTDVYQLHWYLEKEYGLKNERNINKAMNIAASENRYHPIPGVSGATCMGWKISNWKIASQISGSRGGCLYQRNYAASYAGCDT